MKSLFTKTKRATLTIISEKIMKIEILAMEETAMNTIGNTMTMKNHIMMRTAIKTMAAPVRPTADQVHATMTNSILSLIGIKITMMLATENQRKRIITQIHITGMEVNMGAIELSQIMMTSHMLKRILTLPSHMLKKILTLPSHMQGKILIQTCHMQEKTPTLTSHM